MKTTQAKRVVKITLTCYFSLVKISYSFTSENIIFIHFRYTLISLLAMKQNTLQPLYNTVRYNTVLDITPFKDGSQKCKDYIEK